MGMVTRLLIGGALGLLLAAPSAQAMPMATALGGVSLGTDGMHAMGDSGLMAIGMDPSDDGTTSNMNDPASMAFSGVGAAALGLSMVASTASAVMNVAGSSSSSAHGMSGMPRPVPEPGAIFLFAAGALVVGTALRRRQV